MVMLKMLKMRLLIIILILHCIKGDEISDFIKELTYKIDLLKNEFDSYKQDVENQFKNCKEESTCDSDWISYSDRKCYKVLERKGSETEAKTNCSQLDSSSTLITIQSEEEQIFVQNFLKNYSNISNFVWIGLEYINKTFQWMDGKEFHYQNWDENAEKDGNNKCVQMFLTGIDFGKWSDDNCKKNYLIVCQKKQSSKSILSEEIKNITKFIEKQQKQINSLIPLGFLYTQFPNQSTPQELWPNIKWSEVTQQYAGLFFRAEGSGSEAFGQNQQANYSRISNFNYVNCAIKKISYDDLYSCGEVGNPSINEGDWSKIHGDGGPASISFKFFMTSGENRPRNTAIKIWKRIQ